MFESRVIWYSQQMNNVREALRDRCAFIFLFFGDILLFFVAKNYTTFIKGFSILPPWYLAWTSKLRAKRLFNYASREVPAYKSFISGRTIKNWEDIPFTDKENYIKKYPTEERCLHGEIPGKGVAIDESSGSTGVPSNWVRSMQERKDSHAFISYFATFCFGKKPLLTINAFSMGSWATGVNMGIALQRNGILKNTGPDIGKILNTLKFFGPKYEYLMTGYPPFLKQLIDYAKEQQFPWNEYTISTLLGGEGMSEGLRDYLQPDFKKIYSGYGATDLEIGMAGETPVSVAIRRLAKENPVARKALFGEDSRLPMIFQYNPVMHYIEVNNNKELIFTITRKSVLSPRIKYNIHDEGGICRYDQMKAKLLELNVDIDNLTKNEENKNLKFPFVWVYGRRDFTISIMGANIYPEDIEQCVYSDARLAKITRSFCQSVIEDTNASVRPAFYFEITETPTEELKNYFAKIILEELINLNADFREAWHEYPDTLRPEIYLFGIGEGPFKADLSKIKQTRLVKKAS